MTIGGMLGAVVTIRDQEVALKVDESNNTKVTFLKTSIQEVITDGDLGTPNKLSRSGHRPDKIL